MKKGKIFPVVLLILVFTITSNQVPLKAKNLVEGMVNFYSTLSEYEKLTGKKITKFNEAPVLREKVAKGELPPVEERLPEEPMVMVPLEEIGQYGGKIRCAALSPTTGGAECWTARTQPLLMISPDLKSVSPNVAKGWEFSEDYKTLTIYLRRGMKWSDGAPFTADDFVFWYEDLLSNDQLVPTRPEIWRSLVNVEKVDDYTVKFYFDVPYPSIIVALAYENRMYYQIPFAPKHFLKKYHIKYNPQANELAKSRGFDSWVQLFQYEYPDEVQQRWDVNVPTIDPWTMTRVDSYGNKYFEINPYYWKIDPAGNQLPYIYEQDRLLFEDMEAVSMSAIAGGLDYLLQFSSMDNYPLYKENEDKGDYWARIWYDGRGNVLDVRLNLTHKDPVLRKIFNDVRFRQALSLAIDREEVNEVIYRGLATPRAGTIVPDVSYYEDWMGNYYAEYNPEKANQLLDEMGLKWDKNHEYRLRPDGKTLSINIEYVMLESKMDVLAELLKRYWEDIGVKVSTKLIDQTLFGQRSSAGELDLTIWNVDQTTELGFYANPTFQSGLGPAPNSVEWVRWINSNGKQGIEPPEEVKRWYKLAQDFQKQPLGSEGYKRIGKELVSMALKNLWHIGIIGLAPKPCLTKRGLGNVKDKGLFVYSYRFWMIYHPEQWYWK